MEVIILPTREQATVLTARLIAKALRQKPTLVLGLATGRTMERLYCLLGNMHRDERLDFSLCRTFNLDEYIGLPPESPLFLPRLHERAPFQAGPYRLAQH